MKHSTLATIIHVVCALALAVAAGWLLCAGQTARRGALEMHAAAGCCVTLGVFWLLALLDRRTEREAAAVRVVQKLQIDRAAQQVALAALEKRVRLLNARIEELQS